jgi:hypothetical protein
VIYLRPYTEDVNGTRTAYYPNYVLATTVDAYRPIEVDPTTPVLRLDRGRTRDTSLTVYWVFLKPENDMEYELAYSERLANYPDGVQPLLWPQVSQMIFRIPGDDDNLYCTIPDLFPDTNYYIWIRAVANNASGRVRSAWSNPIDGKTLDIEPPNPPQGLGPAGAYHVDAYNRLNGTTYAPIEKDAIILEWMRDGEDTGPPATTGTSVSVSSGSATALTLALEEAYSMYMVRYSGLISNRSYYARAKTVKTVTRAGSGGIETQYAYIVQVSLEDDFKDYIQFTIPAITPLASLDPIYSKRKESAWSVIRRLYTSKSNDEYDGDSDPEQYPLPEQDWEIIYDPLTATYTFRFRSDQKDASGANDNLVDQRFISRLIADKTFVYPIDLSQFGTRRINTRVVQLPYSIIKAFDERKITMEIKADNATFSFSPGSFNTPAVRAVPDVGMGSQVKLSIAAYIPTGLPALTPGESYASAPQKLSAQVITPTRTITLDSFAKPVGVRMALDSRVIPAEQNVGAFFSDPNSGGWNNLPSQYVPAAPSLNTTTYKPGTFAGIMKSTPATTVSDPSRDAMFRVTANVNITDMAVYNPTASVSPAQFGNLVAAVAYGRSQATMNTALSAADTQSLERAKMLVQGQVTREAAMNALVTLYELKAKRIVQPTQSVSSTPYTEIAGAPDAYRQNLLKAADIGFPGGPTRLRSTLTLGDFMQMLDIILQDAGL